MFHTLGKIKIIVEEVMFIVQYVQYPHSIGKVSASHQFPVYSMSIYNK